MGTGCRMYVCATSLSLKKHSIADDAIRLVKDVKAKKKKKDKRNMLKIGTNYKSENSEGKSLSAVLFSN